MQQQSFNSDEIISIICCKKTSDDYNNTLPWYHGTISKELTAKLLSPAKDGLFLVKDSTVFPGDFSLCVKFKNKIFEYRIKRYDTSKLTGDDVEFFDSLEELIERYKNKRIDAFISLSHYVLKECEVEYIKSKNIHIHQSSYNEFGRMFVGTYNERKILLKKVTNVDVVEGILKRSVCHENLLNLIGLTKFNKIDYLVSSYTKYGTLLDHLRMWSKTTYVRKFVYNFAYDICSGMEYLEKKCIVHKYLAARNVWLCRNGIAKLSNFGLSEEYEDSYKELPYRHLAPEVLITNQHSHEADMWSFGVTFWEMFSNGAVPYTDYVYYRILKFLRSGQRLPHPCNCPSTMYEIMQNCWLWNACDRPKFGDMKKKFSKLRIDLFHPEFLSEH